VIIKEQKRIQKTVTFLIIEDRIKRLRLLLCGISRSCDSSATIFMSSFSLHTGTRMPENKGKVVGRLPGQSERFMVMVHNRRSAISGDAHETLKH